MVSNALYGEHVRDGVDALVASTVDDWEKQLARLIEQTPLRRRIQRNARKNVIENHALDTGWSRWLEALSGSLSYYQNSKVQLHAA